MTIRTVRFLGVIALTAFLPNSEAGAALRHQEKKADQKAAPGVTGSWAAAIKGSPHGDVTMGLELAQEGKKVTGTLASPTATNCRLKESLSGSR